jgi:hypothetical protein
MPDLMSRMAGAERNMQGGDCLTDGTEPQKLLALSPSLRAGRPGNFEPRSS